MRVRAIPTELECLVKICDGVGTRRAASATLRIKLRISGLICVSLSGRRAVTDLHRKIALAATEGLPTIRYAACTKVVSKFLGTLHSLNIIMPICH